MAGTSLATKPTDSFYQTREWKMGDSAQCEWARTMARKGYAALPTYGMTEVDQATKAPVLFVQGGLVVAPDVLLMKIGKDPVWNDVKAKSKPSWFRKLKRWEHGCDYSLALEYQKVQEKTGLKMFIVIQENFAPVDPLQDSEFCDSKSWLAIALDKAFKVGQHRPTWPGGSKGCGRRGMGGLLWPRSEMQPVSETS